MKFRDLSSGIGKNFLRIKAGEEVRGIFRGDPIDFRQHWHNGRGEICGGRDTCELCKAGEKSAFRFRINFMVNENGAYVAKVFEQGKAVYESLKNLHKDYPLDGNLFKITRYGTGTDTTYSVLPLPNGKVSEAAMAAIEKVKLNELLESTQSAPEPETEDEEETDDIPF